MSKTFFIGLACMLVLNTYAGADSDSERHVRVFIGANGLSVSEYVAAYQRRWQRTPERAQQLRRARTITRAHELLRARIAPFVVREHSALRVALNGFRATVRAQDLDTLRRQKGVSFVRVLRPQEPDNIYSVPWVEAPKLWDNLGTAENIVIAIIDTGIDYTHAGFGGSGAIADFANNHPNIIEPGTFPTAKVIGGWDFAGPTYNSREDKDPEPDPDPLDIHGHGSHVAGTAAGNGVPQVVGAGVARGARLMALKVFGDTGGSTDLTVDAIERALDPNQDGAMDDAVDVINMSLGARFGLPTDPSAVAAGNAMNAGVIVVASAGNNGDLPYVTGAPAVSPPVISVAATTPGDRRQIALKVIGAGTFGGGLFPAIEGSSAVRIGLAPEVREIVLASSVSSDSGAISHEACTALDNAAAVSGRFVLVMRGACNFRDKFLHVQSAGGAGLIAINTSDDVNALAVMGNLVEGITIPGLMITRVDGQALIDEVNAGTTLAASFSTAHTLPVAPAQNDVLASFSSRGPGTGSANFKPDLAAPGRLIFSAAAGSGQQGLQLRGTSMAAPHVTGMAALLRQQYPSLPPSAIKSLLKNSAVPSHSAGPGTDTPEALSRQGSGVVRGGAASLLTAYTTPSSVSFGYLNVPDSGRYEQTVVVNNLASRATTYAVTHQPARELSGVTVTCPDTLSVDGSAAAAFTLALDLVAADIPGDDARKSVNEVSGWCVFDDGEQTLRVAYMANVDGASDLKLGIDAGGPKLTNSGVVAGIASSYLLAALASAPADEPSGIQAVGWRESELFTFPLLEIAVVMRQPWENPSNLSWFMFLDTDGDGTSERVLYALDWSNFGFDPGNIVTGIDFVNDPADIGSDQNISHWVAENVDYNDRVIVLPFFMASSGINAIFKPGETSIDFRLVAVDRYDEQSEISGHLDLTDTRATEFNRYEVLPGEQIPLTTDSDTLWIFPTNVLEHQMAIGLSPD